MATSVTLNAVSYSIPAQGEGSWGTAVSSYLIALSTGVLQKAGGTFTLTADVDFGGSYGLKAMKFSSRTTPATTGIVRLGNNESVAWRNAANSADLAFKVNASNVLEFDGNPMLTLALGAAYTTLKMNAGGTAYEWGKLTNDNIDAAAGIVDTKLATIATAGKVSNSATTAASANTASAIVARDGSGNFTAGTVTATMVGNITGNVTEADTITLDGQASAPSNPAAGNYTAYIPDSDGKLHILNSNGDDVAVGSGSSGRNYLSDWYDAAKAVGTITNSLGDVVDTSDRTANKTTWGSDGTDDVTFSDTTTEGLSSSALRQSKSYVLKHVSTGAGFIESPLFSLDKSDLGKPLTVTFDVSGVATSDDWQVYVVRYDTDDLLKERITIAGTASATSPYSARIPTGTSSFQGFFIAGSTSTDQYALRFVRNSASDTTNIVIDSLYVGPQSVVQGAAVCEVVAPTVTWTNATGLTINTSGLKFHRVGKRMNVVGTITFVGTGSDAGALAMSLTGYSWSTTEQAAGWVRGEQDTTGYAYTFMAYAASSTALNFYTQNLASSSTTLKGTNIGDGTSGDYQVFYCDIWLNITTWADSVTMANRAVEEYAHNSTVTNANDTSAFAYGAYGSMFPDVSASAKYKRVRFTTPILATDKLSIEWSGDTGATWRPVENTLGTLSATTGMEMIGVSGSTTDLDIYFGSGGYAATPSSAAAAWGGIDNNPVYRWRVRKVSGGGVVGYPINSRNIVGDTSGTTVPAGVIGEKISASLSNTSLTTATPKSVTGTLTLTPGIWLIRAQAHFDGTGSTTWASQSILSISTTTDTLDTGGYVTYEPTSLKDHLFQVSRLVNISASTPYYLVAQCVFGASTAQIAAATSFFEAVRIA